MKPFFLRFLSFCTISILFLSCQEVKVVDSVANHYSDYIQGYSNGTISKNDKIRIDFSKNIDPSKTDWSALREGLFQVTPEIEGEVVLEDNNTIVFKPQKALRSGESYRVSLFLDKLFKVADSLKQFTFTFDVVPQSYQVSFLGIETNSEHVDAVNLKGTLDFADVVTLEEAKKIISARLLGSEIPITWEDVEGQKKSFTFKVNRVTRRDATQNVVLKWDGDVLDIPIKNQKVIEIPALGDFSLLKSYVVTSPSYYVSLKFSDPVQENQVLDGLIEIEGETVALRFEIEGNEIKVYVPDNFDAAKTVLIHEGVKNIFGKKIGKTIEAHIIFKQTKPSVRFVSDGTILPSSQGLIIPFEAVNLKAVDVRIKKVYSDNMLQFFQVNNYDGSRQLSRVGEIVYQKVVSLASDPKLNLSSWNRFTLDLDKMIKKDMGAIYIIEVGFRKHQSLYLCEDEGTSETTIVDESSTAYWSLFDRHVFEGNYNWQERENPCKSAYFGNKHTITRNVFASDIGLIIKKGEGKKMTFFVTDLKTTDPIVGAKVQLYSYQQRVFHTATTDQEGKCVIELEREPFIVVASFGENKTFLKLQAGASLSLSNFEVGGKRVEKGVKGFLYAERGVWRPGDSLFISMIVEDKQSLIPVGQPVIFELKNPRGQLVERKVVTENTNGVYNFLTKTEDSAPTGSWNVTAKAGGVFFSKELKIETIKPNRLKINLDFGKKLLTHQDRLLDGVLNVKWLHGAKGSELKSEFTMNLKESSAQFDGYQGYSFYNPSIDFSSEELSIFEGKTDKDGQAKVKTEINLAKKVPAKLNAVFSGKVYEPSGNYSISYQSIPFYPYESMVGIQIPGVEKSYSFIETDLEHNVNIACVDESGKGVTRNGVSVKLYKLNWSWWWDYNSGRSNYNHSHNRELVSSGKVDVLSGRGRWGFKVDYPSWGRYLVEVTDPISGHTSGKIFYVDWPYWRGSSKKGMDEGASMLQLSAEKEVYNIGEQVKIKVPTAFGGNVLVSLETGSRILRTFWVKSLGNMTEISFEVDKTMAPNIYANIIVLQPHMQTANDLPIRMYGVIPIMVEDASTKLKPMIKMAKELEPLKPVKISVSEANGKPMTFTLAVVDEGLLDLTNFRTPVPWNHFYAKEALGVNTWDIYDQVIGAYTGDLQHLLAIGGDMSKSGEKQNKVKRFKPVVKYFGPYFLSTEETKSIEFTMPNYIGSVKTMIVAAQDGAYGQADQVTPVRQPLMVLATMPRVLAPGEVVDVPISVFSNDQTVQNAEITFKSNAQLTVIGENLKKVSFDKPGEELVTFKVKATNQLGNAHVEVFGKSGKNVSIDKIDLEVRSPNPPITKVYDKVLGADDVWELNLDNVGVSGTNELTLEVSSLPSMNLENRLKYLIRYPHGCVEQTTSSVFPQLFLSEITTIGQKQKNKITNNIKAGIKRLYRFKTSEGGLSYWPGNRDASEWGSNYAMHFLILAQQNGYYVQENFINEALSYLKRKAREFSGTRNYMRMQQAYRLYVLALAGKADVSAMNRLSSISGLSNAVKMRLAASYALLNKTDVASKVLSNLSTNENIDDHYRWYTYGSPVRDKAMALETMVLMRQKENAFTLLKGLAESFSTDSWMSTQTTAYGLYAYAKYVRSFQKHNSGRISYSFDKSQERVLYGEETVLKRTFDPSKKESHVFNFKNVGGQMLYVKVYAEGIPLEADKDEFQDKIELKVWYTDKDEKVIDESAIKQGTEFIAHLTVKNKGIYGNYKDLALTEVIPSGWEIRNTRLNSGETSVDGKVDYVDIRDDRILLYFDLDKYESKQFDFEMHATFTGEFAKPPVSVSAMYDNSIKAQIAGGKVLVTK